MSQISCKTVVKLIGIFLNRVKNKAAAATTTTSTGSGGGGGGGSDKV